MNPDSMNRAEAPAAPKPPPRPLGRRPIGLAFAAAVVGASLGGGGVWLALHGARPAPPSESKTDGSKKPALYQCPMHPTITSDHPSDCPICGMRLVPVAGSADAKAGAPVKPGTPPSGERKIAFYRSPMDPKQTSPTFRKDEMGMDYLPVYEDELTGAAPVPGLATVTIDPARQQLIGLRTTAVTRGAVGATWRTVGRVQVDPRGVRKINVKVEGYVERAFVDFVGQEVKRGQPLFTMYSPSLLAAQNELLLALQTREALEKAGGPSANGDALVSSARRKLELWDVPADELARLEKTGKASKNLTVHSPISGVVTVKNLVEGARLSPGDAPYEITDLGAVWVMADAYESDVSKVRVGMPATLTLESYPNRKFVGEVAFLEPVLDPKTRTLKVHLHFRNPRGELKPEMFGEVELQGKERQGLHIPSDAVVRSGERDVVFLALQEGKFQPREVRLGARSGDQVEVSSGLEEGERVVTRANFLVDSESQLRASLAAIGGK
jgi:Cu(I)/Ag(I) efflux system membrane fusion protein